MQLFSYSGYFFPKVADKLKQAAGLLRWGVVAIKKRPTGVKGHSMPQFRMQHA